MNSPTKQKNKILKIILDVFIVLVCVGLILFLFYIAGSKDKEPQFDEETKLKIEFKLINENGDIKIDDYINIHHH